jgi:hypothetical protein
MKVICASQTVIQKRVGDLRCVLFGRASKSDFGSAGPTLLQDVGRFGLRAPVRVWDLVGIALAVNVADQGCPRGTSSDGWTRQIELEVAVKDFKFWQTQRLILETTLRFLTGDIWNLRFLRGGCSPPKPKKRRLSIEDSVCLLSGGADSLAGAIDVVSSKKQPLLVSQVSNGDKGNQKDFAIKIAGPGHHLQLNHNIDLPGDSERSQRARSLIFIAYGVLAATALKSYSKGATIPLFIPENGFISLNVPLTPLRLGTLSTRTTHPHYLKLLQQVLDAAGLRVRMDNPFRLKTKGELLRECKNQPLLQSLICESTSCGRFARMSFKHCGRCVPCLVRRSAFHAAGIEDKTTYVYKNLSIKNEEHRNFDDVRSAAFAVEQVKAQGLDRWIGGALSTTLLGPISEYRDLLSRSVQEISSFLKESRVL